MDGKNKKELGYTANIKYQEDYITDYTQYKQLNNESTIDDNQGSVDDDDFMQMVHDDIKDLIQLVPKLPTNVQTAINQVLKPVIRAWKKIKDNEYPRHIPDDKDPHIIIPPGSTPEPEPKPDPTPEPDNPWRPNPTPPPTWEDSDPWNPTPDPDDPWGPDPWGPDPWGPDPWGPDPWGPDPWKPDPDPDDPWGPDPWKPDPDPWNPNPEPDDPWSPNPWSPNPPIWTPPIQENPDPMIIVPSIINPIPDRRENLVPKTILISPIITDDDLFRPATNRRIEYEVIDEVEKMRMEYTKNLAEVIHHYTSNLKDLVLEFFMNKISALTSATDEQDVSFIVNEITENNCSTSDQLRHLMDSALRNEVISTNKLHFSLNTFSLESTLYHLKNFNAVQELRLRYAKIKKLENNEMIDSTSNNILNGVRDMYDKKYDLAYINLYKYLNGSLNILEDCLRTMETSTKSKETLIRKDGLNK